MSALQANNVMSQKHAVEISKNTKPGNDTEMSNFGKLRQSNKYDVITVIPNKLTPSADVAAHFPNAAKKANEFQGQEMKQASFFKRLKSAVGSIGKDKSHLEIDESDLVHWRRAHLAQKEKSRLKANAERGQAFIDSRKERLESQEKVWKERALKGAHKDEISAKKAHFKQVNDSADARREKRLSDVKAKLASKDKDRKIRAKKALAEKKKLAKEAKN
eukprot:GILK01009047.1.p1 GENE.GILK01009047.1~~GILK01009047.1.p1  ORF type:complete len:237 (-),score=43.62 GILK01009047.1:197-850(-)